MASDASAQLRLRSRASRAALLSGIYVIINEGVRMFELACAALDGGVRVVQYRAKQGLVSDHLGRLRDITSERNALLIVNDDWHAAADFDCDGVHLGPGDEGFANVALVRNALATRLIGLSCGTLDEVRRANAEDADYLGIGSIYSTPSKHDAGAPIGIAGLQELASAAEMRVAAIGGIGLTNITQVRQTGVAMAAVISAIAGSGDPKDAARHLVSRWNAARQQPRE